MNLAALYPLVRPVLFALEAERAHDLTLENLRRAHGLGLDGAWRQPVLEVPRTVMGLRFPNPVGLAAGLDKDGRYIAALAELGFGFLEIGTVTPRAQPGNPKPRMFRLSDSQALINRMGFNNGGLDAFLKNIAAANFKGILGLNIGKNADTPIERAAEDYRACLSGVYAHASYVTVNVSSPNTKNLRQLQDTEALGELLGVLKGDQERLAQRHGRYVPLVLKVAPDLEPEAVRALARVAVSHRVDGLIATNTTVSRDAVAGARHSEELGGLSGAPLRGLSDAVIRILRDELGGAIPIIGVGGILSGADARSKIEAGASLVQLYTGLIYRGPALIAESVKALREDGD